MADERRFTNITAVEESFPVVNKPLTGEQWSSVTTALGNGTIDEGTGDYRISLDNASNTVSVEPPAATGFAHATVGGYYHRIYGKVSLPCPPVTETTTYVLAIVLDPLRQDSEPLKLELFKAPINYSGNKKFLVFCEIIRKPNELLSQAKVNIKKPRVSPSIDVQDVDNLPPAKTQPFGTIAYVNSERSFYRRSAVNGSGEVWARVAGSRQIPANFMPGWVLSPSSPNNAGIITNPITEGFYCQFSGILQRNAFDYTVRREWSVLGVLIPENLRTKRYTETIFPALWNTRAAGIFPVVCRINFMEGYISIRANSDISVPVERGGELHIPAVSWVSDKSNIIEW
jgi:hypothetical protein|nr:MAG TPA: hypothetical protein [Caudoviricetes sp.]